MEQCIDGIINKKWHVRKIINYNRESKLFEVEWFPTFINTENTMHLQLAEHWKDDINYKQEVNETCYFLWWEHSEIPLENFTDRSFALNYLKRNNYV